jgi:hypothetical protein
MGAIDVTIDRDADLTVLTVTGPTSADEIRGAIDRYFEREPTSGILWDFREADLRDISAQDVRGLVEVAREHAARRGQGRTALVLPSDLGFGLGRMYETLQEHEPRPAVHYKAFREMDAATAWVGGG